MRSKKDTFSTFFTALQYFRPSDGAKLFTNRLIGKKADISWLTEFLKTYNSALENFNSFILINDIKRSDLLYVSPSVYFVTGYSQDEFLKGGNSMFIKNYCPADRLNGLKILERISSHQKLPIPDKSYYQYITTFRFLHKNGYYNWMYNRMMFVSHDEHNIPWVLLSIITNMENYKIDDNINFARLKFNPDIAEYETEFIEKYSPDYLSILNQTELNILKLMAQGMDNSQIAVNLGYKENTIKDYRKKMLKKTWCENTAELLTFALRNELIA
jgi:DNA-binding CsgD family transcriptional regulator